MFQMEGDAAWYSLNLIGKQTGYSYVDATPTEINDGKWHRVTWDLRRLVSDRVNATNHKITQIIIGSWEQPSKPLEVEFQDFTMGKRNLLD